VPGNQGNFDNYCQQIKYDKKEFLNETDISAQQNQTGQKSWIFEENVDQTGQTHHQPTKGQRQGQAGGLRSDD
jgi:hypothetical protein